MDNPSPQPPPFPPGEAEMPPGSPQDWIPFRRSIPPPQSIFQSAFGRWLERGAHLDEAHLEHVPATHPWWRVIWLTGVDYFSTLGYQPGIALLAAGAVAPLATGILVLVTLLGALPIYAQVARRSYAGQGSIAMLEHLLPGWFGKILVLVLLGFAATDFVITMTLSAADAAKHAIENPFLHPVLGDAQTLITLILLTLLAAVFLIGFKEAIGLAAFICVPYLLLNGVVLVRALVEVANHPTVIPDWREALFQHGDWTMVLIAAGLIFPKLALGLSGFETGVAVMPLVDGGRWDERRRRRGAPAPLGRIRNTRKLLVSAALIMSVMLMASSFATTLLIPEVDYRIGGPASGRAIAYLAHKYLGPGFGTVYDFSTILILWMAGASAMAGLLHLVPRYLPRYGMAPVWASMSRPLVLVLLGISVIVTWVFRASVEAQSGAYATGVLVLILSAAFAATLALWKERQRITGFYCGLLTLVFAFTLVDNCIGRPDGLIIGGIFILLVLTVSSISRWSRATELRVLKAYHVDRESYDLAPELIDKRVNMVPIKVNTPEARAAKAREIRTHYRVDGPLLFIHVNLMDNRSDFLETLEVQIRREGGGDFVMNVWGATAIANTIAYLSELADPIGIFLGLTRQNLMQQALRFILFGEGETGLMVYKILLRYWETTREEDVRPYIYLMSD